MKMRRFFGVTVLAALCLAMLSGCSVERDDLVVTFSTGDEAVLVIGERACTASQARVFLCNYQNIYGEAYGMDLWQHDFGERELSTYVKDVTLSELSRMLSMDALATSRGIELEANELEKVQNAAAEYFSSLSDAELTYMDIDEEGISELYTEYALAEKIYNVLTAGVNYEVSEDEARVMTIQQIYVTDEASATLISAALAEGTDFQTLAAQYNENAQIESNIKRGELPIEVENAAYALDSGEVSEAIASSGGWYFVRCVNKNVEDLTVENKRVIAQDREKEASADVYDAFVETLDSTLNTDLWESIEPDLTGEITTDSFFTTYEAYFH